MDELRKVGTSVARQRDSGFPSTETIVAFIRAHPGKVGTSEIAREFGLKNADRAVLKRLLRELADEGIIKKRGKEVGEPETRHHEPRQRRRVAGYPGRMGRGRKRRAA